MLTAIAVLFFAATASAQTINDVKAKYNEAAALIQARNYAAAITALEQTIDMGFEAGAEAGDIITASQKMLPGVYLQQAVEFTRNGQLDKALTTLNSTVELGELYGDTRNVAKARQLTSQVYTAMGAEAYNEGNFTKAIEIFSKGYEVNPSDTKLALYLAESYAESGDLTNAFRIYDDLIALESRHSRYKAPADEARDKKAYYMKIRANELAQSGNTQQAYAMFDEFLKSNPTDAVIHLMRVQTAATAQDWQRVIRWGEESAQAQTDPANKSEVYYYLGAAYQNSQNIPMAIEIYHKVLEGGRVAEAQEQLKALGGK